MSLGTASFISQRCVCTFMSMMIVLTIAIGLSTSTAASMGGGMTSDMSRESASQACQAEVSGSMTGQPCDAGDDEPRGYAACPMSGLCANMSSGPTHCGLLGLTSIAELNPENISFATVRYLRTEVHAADLPADPRFHPPIL